MTKSRIKPEIYKRFSLCGRMCDGMRDGMRDGM